MDNTEKNLTLIEELIQHTKNGSLAWKKAADGKSYMASLPDYAIRISYTPLFEYRLRIFDNSGNVRREIGTIYDLVETVAQAAGVTTGYSEISQIYAKPLRILYELVAGPIERIAGDQFVDGLLSQLQQLKGEGARGA
ncbi:MAG TPA: hypothetical protein VJ183_06700 [Chloroflexia bacterium]|nr:hypothetical protein [Chloroflexia bacterium]